jgi:signal transduction histidine kinase
MDKSCPLDNASPHWSIPRTIENWTSTIRHLHYGIRCALTIGLACLGVLARYLMVPYWGLGPPFVTFYPAVLLAGVFGGFGCGVVATVVCVIGADYFLFTPADGVHSRDSGFELLLFLVVGVLISLFIELLARARETAHREKSEAVAQSEIATSARREAEIANQAKDQFLAMVSHELRSPLTAVLGGVDILKKKWQCPPEAAPIMDLIERNTKTEARLVEDLLDLSRASTGKMTVELNPCRLRQIIDTAIASMRPAFEAKRLHVSFEMLGADKEVFVDPQRVQQIVTNLLTNAVKFTDAGGWVRVELDERSKSAVELRVSDSGIGIDEQLHSHLFDPFHQGDSGRQNGGLGLGLAIAKNLVELHRGTIQVKSDGPDLGATFTVRLPIS